MKHRVLPIALVACLLAAFASTAPAQTAGTSAARAAPSQERPAITERSDEQQARDWGLRTDEWARYRELMQGPLGIQSPNLDPLTALGIEARSDEERRRYAELQVQVEARRVEKTLAYQRAYDEAWRRLAPGAQRVNLPGAGPASTPAMAQGADRTAVFVKDACAACDAAVQRLQAAGTEFDIYMVGSRADDARIRDWARRVRIDPAKVRSRRITLNHDAGRWLSLGLPGDLPAVVRQVGGQWQRQP
ncbi:TIGR03759 family integrating conjugative element protein [Achromobacter pulmonis]|uniref:TIGR03759 family integrating conjugative element protein n=1 Tax=Achromobacter pulmonis TaxID=1389932 RepID=A0A2N8K8J1_9BURK|nr:TIGR03759 family integrating conjugative element protein [Achromobacter pulmonis]MBO9333117.1 TIGR03759 family integrating conjugative element protein [Achromobacter xylosoxidans]PND29767.1 TIGR03759 family integrating conjugative element protein [Achromobacter pulmonis]